jgi:methyl-accepting chemotaxis protein
MKGGSMMTWFKTRCRGESGLAAGLLVGVIAWALAAVVMLTSTLVTANQIDDTVLYIRTQVSPIDKDLDAVKLAEKTNEIASGILTAAKPLSGQLGTVLENTNSIDATAKSIDTTAGQINQVVNSITSTAGEINGSAHSINDKVHAINGSVRSIQGSVNEINPTAKLIEGNFAGTLAATRSIIGDHNAKGVGTGLFGAAHRVDALIALIQGVKGDTGNILAKVGTIQGSAKSIDNKL